MPRITDPATLFPAVRTRRAQNVTLAIAELDVEENRAWEERLRRAAAACGCSEGAVGLLGAVSLYGAVLYRGFSWSPASLLGRLLAMIGIAAVGLGLGKALGLHRARRKTIKLVEELAALVAKRNRVNAGRRAPVV